MKIHNTQSCAIKEFVGVNDTKFTLPKFKELLLDTFKDMYHDKWRPAEKFCGALLFSGAYNTDVTDDFMGRRKQNLRNKKDLMIRIESIMKFIEEEGIGEMVEMPEFTNNNHGTTIVPFMWHIDMEPFKVAQKRWYKDGVRPKQDSSGAAGWQL